MVFGCFAFGMGCREVGFWFGGAFCRFEFHLSLGHQKAALGSFFAVRFWLVWARVYRWCLAVSHGLPRGRFGGARQGHCMVLLGRVSSFLMVLHGRVSSFFRASESDVRQLSALRFWLVWARV